MIAEFLSEKIEKITLPFLDVMGLELVELNIRRHNGETTIQIFADKHHGGITLDECTALNRRVSEIIEAQNIISERYTLEVSSPGLDRPLKTAKDFKRVLGRRVQFYLNEPVANRLEYAGEVKNADDNGVVIGVTNDEIMIPLDKINKAKQII